MSADYDRLFHSSSEPGKPLDDATITVDRDAILKATASPPPMPTGPTGDQPPTDAPSSPMPVTPPPTQSATQGAHRQAEQPTPPPPPQMPPPPPATPQWQQNSMLRAPQQQMPPGAYFDQQQPRTLPGPPQRVAPGPPPSQFQEFDPEISGAWRAGQAIPVPSQPTQSSAASMGNHRAIDALSHVGVKTGVKMPSQRGWRHWLYLMTRINLGLSPDEVYELELHSRIRRNARDSYQIGVFGLKGGVGKTAVTVALGSAMAKIRGDRILAIDADPDGGNLADRAGRQSAATISDLLADQELSRYNDIRAYTSMNAANLKVLSSEEYSGAPREFNDDDWKGATSIVSRYYNLVLADCGAGLFQKASRGVLSTVSGMVIVASASIDGARQAAITMDWLRQNGYQDLLGRSCVVINHVNPGKPNVDVEDLVQQFERHVPPGRVIVLPWDKHIAAGTEIQLDLLSDTFQRRITELAAALSDDFDRLERR